MIDGEVRHVNLGLVVDAASDSATGLDVRDEEDSSALLGALEDGIATTREAPLAMLVDNRPLTHTPTLACHLTRGLIRPAFSPGGWLITAGSLAVSHRSDDDGRLDHPPRRFAAVRPGFYASTVSPLAAGPLASQPHLTRRQARLRLSRHHSCPASRKRGAGVIAMLMCKQDHGQPIGPSTWVTSSEF